jgi:hypothetical protein
MQTNYCIKCQTEKDVSLFYKDSKQTKGISTYCKTCHREIHRIKAKERREKRKHFSVTKCSRCNRERLTTSKFCLRCWVRSALYGKVKLTTQERNVLYPLLIEKLEASEYSCFYTGIKLVPGLNASLDHRLPLSKGGTNDLNNLEWVHIGINHLKNDRTEKEFISACASILVEYNLLASKGII